MGRRALSWFGGLAIGFGATAAQASYLVGATWTQSIQGIAITVTNSGATCTDTNPAHVPGAGSLTCPTAGLQATGDSTPMLYNVGLTMPLFQFQAFTTGGTIDLATRAILSGPQNIDGNAMSVTATTGIAGMVTVGHARHSMASMWSQPVGRTLVRISLGIGKAGAATGSFIVLGNSNTFLGYHYITVEFYPWTQGTQTFTGLTIDGAALPNLVAMGSSALVPYSPGATMGEQWITLVAPSKISVDGPLAQRRTASFTSLKLRFHVDGIGVPEPGVLLLLTAAALLLGFGRRWSSR